MTETTSAMTPRRTALLGAGLVAIGPVSMALYTPAMPTLAETFGTSDSAVKLTLTSYFAGFAFTQLVIGPLTDAFGRKPVTLVFLTLYLVSSVLATFSPSIEFMVFARALQGIGAAVGISVSRAMVRDLFTGQQSTRIMNAIATMLALGPAVSPTIGGFVLELFGWQEIFWCMIAYGVVLMAAVLWFQVETNPSPGLHHLKPKQLAHNYLSLLKDPRFLAPGLLVGCGLGTLYATTTVLPFILIYQVGLSPSEFGLTMFLQSGSFIVGTLVGGQLMKVLDARYLLNTGLLLFCVASVLMALSAVAFPPSILTIMGPIALFVFALAFIVPSGFTEVMAPFPHIAGAASSMTGFLQFGTGILLSLIIAGMGDPIAGFGAVLPVAPILGVLGYLYFKMRVAREAAAE